MPRSRSDASACQQRRLQDRWAVCRRPGWLQLAGCQQLAGRRRSRRIVERHSRQHDSAGRRRPGIVAITQDIDWLATVRARLATFLAIGSSSPRAVWHLPTAPAQAASRPVRAAGPRSAPITPADRRRGRRMGICPEVDHEARVQVRRPWRADLSVRCARHFDRGHQASHRPNRPQLPILTLGLISTHHERRGIRGAFFVDANATAPSRLNRPSSGLQQAPATLRHLRNTRRRIFYSPPDCGEKPPCRSSQASEFAPSSSSADLTSTN